MVNKEYRKLHAEWYDLISGKEDHTKEINFWEKMIKKSSEPVLELGSGTGRILIPLLERGFDMTGIDISGDVNRRCRQTCRKKGLKTVIYNKSMLDFSLPRKFGLIIMAFDGLGLFTDNKDIDKLFERVMAHLKPGGLFVFEFHPLLDKYKENDYNRSGWIEGSGGVVIVWRSSRKYERAENLWKWLFIFEKYVNGHLVDTEANVSEERMLTLDEVIQIASSAGFVNITVTQWLKNRPPNDKSAELTIKCRKNK
jgi:SAM-dependent methyltransferase